MFDENGNLKQQPVKRKPRVEEDVNTDENGFILDDGKNEGEVEGEIDLILDDNVKTEEETEVFDFN